MEEVCAATSEAENLWEGKAAVTLRPATLVLGAVSPLSSTSPLSTARLDGGAAFRWEPAHKMHER